MEELVDTLRQLDADDAVRCIVVGGNERAFAAGADIAELAAGTPVSLYLERRIERWDAIRSLRHAARCSGLRFLCLGGGCELALLLRPDRRCRIGHVSDSRRSISA